MSSNIAQRRRLLACLALAAAAAALPAAAATQTAPAPPQTYRRRRVRGLGDVLTIGGIVAAIFGWIVIGGKRARKKEQAKQDMEARLASARARSKNL